MDLNLSIRKGLGLLAIPAALLLTTSTSLAASSSPTLFGDATFNAQGVQLTTTGPNGYSGISLPVPAGMTLSDISSLDATYTVTSGNCGLGSPRFQISLPGAHPAPADHIFAYFGTAPNYNSCAGGTQTQNNLLQPFVDTSQLGGTFYDTYSHAVATWGNQPVSAITVVADGPNQVIEIQSLSVNDTEYNFAAPTSKDQCKDGGWQSFINPGTFKNQGDCVSFVATHGKNGPNG
jgi:hypothetical protein